MTHPLVSGSRIEIAVAIFLPRESGTVDVKSTTLATVVGRSSRAETLAVNLVNAHILYIR
jgi:hypothetical protein